MKIIRLLLIITILQPSLARAMDPNTKKHRAIDHKLWQAIIQNDFNMVVQAQKAGAQVNAIIWDNVAQTLNENQEIWPKEPIDFTYGTAALHLAANKRQDPTAKKICRFLLEVDANPNIRNARGETPLMFAAVCTDILNEAIQAPESDLERMGIRDVFLTLRGWLEMWMHATRNNNLEVYTMLLEKEAQIDDQDSNGDTALMWAIKYQDKAACKLLIHAGANTEIKNNLGRTALMAAAKYARSTLDNATELISICELLFNHQKTMQTQRVITFLCCLKHSSNPHLNLLYRIRQGLQPSLDPVKALLNERDADGKTIRNYLQPEDDYLQVEWLKPYSKAPIEI